MRASSTLLRPSLRLAAAAGPLPATALLLLLAAPASGEAGHGHRLHFAHPLVAESPSPDTKLRLDGVFLDDAEEDGETYTLRLEGELAFAPWISLEVDVPYTFRRPDGEAGGEHLDTVEVALKLASFRFADEGLLLGGGLELGLPTGSDAREIGSSRVLEVEPFVDFGWRRERLEVVGFLSAGFLRNGRSEDADFELGWNLSLLCHLHPRLQALLELDGEDVDGGEEGGSTFLNLTPGLKLKPFAGRRLWLGAGASLPISSRREFDVRGILSAFWHF